MPLERAVAAAQAEDVRNVGMKTPVDEAIAVAQMEDVREEEGGKAPEIVVKPAESVHGAHILCFPFLLY